MTARSRGPGRSVRIGAATAVGAALALSLTGAAYAYDGGCGNQTKDGFTVKACASRSGQDIVPDAYLVGKPKGCFYLAIDVRDHTATSRSRHEYDNVCGTGKFVGDRVNTFWDVYLKAPYYTEVTIVVGNKSTVFDSPYQS